MRDARAHGNVESLANGRQIQKQDDIPQQTLS